MQTETTELTNEPFVLPASYAQQRMWFLDRLESGSVVYNVPSVTRLRGRLDVSALQRALAAVVERHEALRTSFALIDGIPHQVVRPPDGFAAEVVDLSGSADAPERAVELAAEQANESFDLGGDSLIRALIVKIADDDHVLALTLHHIITDGWSMGVLMREVSELYGAFVEGESVELPELAIQYGDYAVWQQEWMESGGLDRQLAYWRDTLAGAPALLELPTDKPRPPEQSFRGSTVRKVFAPELAQRLRALSEREGATMFMTLLAAFTAMLSRYSGQDDVVVGTPVANRSRVELEPVIGLFVNTLALRVTLDDDPSFADLLRRVRESSLEGFSNQDLPFEKLVQELNPERSQSHAPIAQVLFVLQSAIEKPARLAGLEHERLLADRGTAKFDIALFVSEVAAGLRVAIEYCTDLFGEETIIRMLDHFGVLLEAAVADPDRPVSKLPMLASAERELVLGDWSTGPRREPDERCVHDLFTAQAKRTPDAVAVSCGADSLTYAELSARANRLGNRLWQLGVGRDVVVAIAAERSVDTLVAVLATLTAGGAYVAIDPGYPEDRIAYMLSDSGARVLLTQTHLLERLPLHDGETICLDDGEWQSADAVAPAARAGAENLAYVIYTSGSTGQPKGVAMPHRVLVNLLDWQLESVGPQAAARTLQFASLSFDVSFQEIFSTWCSGGTLVLIDEDTRRDAHALVRVISEQEVERLFLPFVALQSFCEAAAHLEVTLPRLREVITAGEQLKATGPVRNFFARHPGCRLFNHYGPSETHVVTSYELTGAALRWPALPPIGRAIAGARIYLLDRHRQPVAIGVPGELYVSGVSVARGYLNRPELTAERFVPDPFAGEPNAVMYRTGDLARHLPDGNIVFLRRADDQVKIRGFRVELGEVEAMLAQHPAVSEAAAVLREDDAGDVRLVGYVVPRDGDVPADRELLAHARRLVPEYMIPQHFVTLDALPLTPSGKVNRRALPEPDGRARTGSEFVAPRTELERSLAEIWQRLLRLDRVSVEDDFFDLGGHSLLAVQVVHAIEEELARICTLPMLFRNGTIASLAGELHAGGVEAAEPTVLRLASDGGEPLYCIAGIHLYQQLAEELAPEYSLYGIFLPLEQELFKAGAEERALRRLSVQDMARRYVAALRELQPDGPYLILGFCFGGVIAYEAAQQLAAAGEEVKLLAMLDTTLGSVLRPNARRPLKSRVRWMLIRNFERLPTPLQRRLVGDPWPSETKRLELVRSRMYSDAMRRYRPEPYGGRSVLIQPEASAKAYARNAADASWGWSRYMEDLDVVAVPGAHQSHLKRPNVHAVARALRAQLIKAR